MGGGEGECGHHPPLSPSPRSFPVPLSSVHFSVASGQQNREGALWPPSPLSSVLSDLRTGRSGEERIGREGQREGEREREIEGGGRERERGAVPQPASQVVREREERRGGEEERERGRRRRK